MRQKGFTLIELVLVIVILGILALGVFSFIGRSVQIFVDVAERDQILSDSRFVIERLNRELRKALPSSFRLWSAGNADDGDLKHCLEWVPIEASSVYFNLPLIPDKSQQLVIVPFSDYDASSISSRFAIIAPFVASDVYDQANSKRFAINAIDESDVNYSILETEDYDDDVDIEDLRFSFAQQSPARRVYIAYRPMAYCVHYNGDITRHQDHEFASDVANIVLNDGILMGQYLVNPLSGAAGSSNSDPFRVIQPTLVRNAAIHLFLKFERNQEVIIYSNEVHIPNAP